MRITTMPSRFIAISAASLFAAASIAQSAPADPPADDESAEQTTEPEALPSLDDLLGLEPDDSDDAEPETDQSIDPDRAELDRALSGEQAADMFVQAVQQMGDAADLLELASAPGAQTQRIQDEILRKLDILIEQAKQQQSSSSSSSSSSGDPSQQQGQQPNQPQPGQQQQEGQQNQQNQGDDPQEGTPPGFQEGPLADRLDELHAAWGALPTRIREALSQGSGDEFSAFYQSMTESYYRKLAGDKPNTEERQP